MEKIKHIFFDLDHTLWDFDKNSTETLFFLFDQHNFNQLHGIQKEEFVFQYHKVNRELWELFNHNIIDKHELRELRLQQTFINLGIDIAAIPITFNEEYIKICPKKGNLFPHTIAMLTYLSSKYNIHILSNGFEEIQAIKIKTSGIAHFFKTVFTADTIGFKKPHLNFYNHVINELNIHSNECIMIGDTLDADVLGAMNAGIKAVYFNPEKNKHSTKLDFEINSLIQLKDFL